MLRLILTLENFKSQDANDAINILWILCIDIILLTHIHLLLCDASFFFDRHISLIICDAFFFVARHIILILCDASFFVDS